MTIYLTEHAYLKLKYYVMNVDTEISGMGLVDVLPQGNVLVTDLFLFDKTTGSAAGTEIDKDGLVKFVQEHPEIDTNKLKLWWHCITGKTPIIMANGKMLTAEQVYNSEYNRIIGLNLETHKFEKIDIADKKKFNAPCFKITTTGKRSIEVTGNHKMLTMSGWKEVEQLKKDDYIAIPLGFSTNPHTLLSFPKLGKYKKVETTSDYSVYSYGKKMIKLPLKINEKLAEIFGWIVNEGSISNKSFISISQKDVANLEEINKNIEDVFGIKGKIRKNISKPDHKRDCHELIICNSLLARFLIKNGINNGRGVKRVPKITFTSKISHKKAFIDSMIRGDGYVDMSHSEKYYRIYTAYKDMASDLLYLLGMLGYKANIRTMKSNFPNKNYEIIYDVFFKKSKHPSPIDWVRIRSIEDIGEKEVFAFSVPNIENFICGHGGFISHNSHCDFQVCWSTTDDNCIEDPLGMTTDFLISIVANKKMKILGRVDTFSPFRLKNENVPVDIALADEELEASIKAEINEKIKKNTYMPWWKENDEDKVWQNGRWVKKKNKKKHKKNKKKTYMSQEELARRDRLEKQGFKFH